MYRVDNRFSNRCEMLYWSSRTDTPQTKVVFGDCQSVYSFRSGGVAPLSSVHIPVFSKMEKPAERLQALGRFYRDFSESSAALSTAAASEGDRYHSTSDTGHEFLTINVSSTPSLSRWFRPYKGYEVSTIASLFPNWRVPSLPLKEGPMANYLYYLGVRPQDDIVPSGLNDHFGRLSSRLDRQSEINAMFSTVRASKPALDIGETLLELVRGGPFALLHSVMDILGAVFRSSKRSSLTGEELIRALSGDAIGAAKRTAGRTYQSSKEAGKAYLAGTFGLSPVIQDIMKVIDHLSMIHATVYGSRERFSARTGLQTQSEKVSSNLESRSVPGYSRETGEPLWALQSVDGSVIRNWDTRLTCRVAGLARPSTTQQGFLDKAQALLYNLGVFEPSLMWELTSFSWLLDWWLHLGTSIANASRLSGSGVNVEYAYVTTKLTTLVTQKQRASDGTGTGQVNRVECAEALSKRLTVVKYRRRATPFGFGGDLSSLTSGQMGILVALGLAKAR